MALTPSTDAINSVQDPTGGRQELAVRRRATGDMPYHASDPDAPYLATPLLLYKLIAAATTNPQLVRTGAGRVMGGSVTNFSAAIKYLKFTSKATAPIPGTDAPVITIPIPVGGTVALAAVFSPSGLYLPLGIGISITGALADLDATAVAANDVLVNLLYI